MMNLLLIEQDRIAATIHKVNDMLKDKKYQNHSDKLNVAHKELKSKEIAIGVKIDHELMYGYNDSM
jgi:hypothetical protein